MPSQDNSRTQEAPQFLSLSQVVRQTSLASETLLRLEAKDQFPKRVLLSDRRIAWVKSEVEFWLTERVRRRDEAAKLPPVQRRPLPFDDDLDDRIGELRRLDTS
jgi:predicted DNA-binding transcriptional regulator AlpA